MRLIWKEKWTRILLSLYQGWPQRSNYWKRAKKKIEFVRKVSVNCFRYDIYWKQCFPFFVSEKLISEILAGVNQADARTWNGHAKHILRNILAWSWCSASKAQLAEVMLTGWLRKVMFWITASWFVFVQFTLCNTLIFFAQLYKFSMGVRRHCIAHKSLLFCKRFKLVWPNG